MSLFCIALPASALFLCAHFHGCHYPYFLPLSVLCLLLRRIVGKRCLANASIVIVVSQCLCFWLLSFAVFLFASHSKQACRIIARIVIVVLFFESLSDGFRWASVSSWLVGVHSVASARIFNVVIATPFC